MRRLILLLVSLAFLVSCGPVPQTPHSPTAAPATPTSLKAGSILGLSWDDPQLYAAGLVQSQRDQYSSIPGATIYHIEFTIDSDLVHVIGHEEFRYTNQAPVPLTELKLHTYPNILGGQLTVTKLTADQKPVQSSYEQHNSILTVPLPQALPPGGNIIIGMDFSVSVPTDPQTNYGVLASVDGVLTLAHSYPMIAVYDDKGWHTEIPAQWGDLTFNRASYYVVSVHAPADVTLIASGRDVSREISSETQTAIFEVGPARDFMLTAARGFEKTSQTVGEITVNSYAPATDKQGSQATADVASTALKIYSQRYAPYPYTELDLVATPTSALGVEYPGMISLAKALLEPETGQYGNTPVSVMRESTVAHETAHQWFYNLVGDDQLNEPWLDESFAQFATWQYFTDRYGASTANGFKASLTGRWQRVDEQKIPVDQPVSAFTAQQYSAIVYGRGALFFFALENQMGTDPFNTFMQSYTDKFTWQVATTPAFEQSAETTCGCNLQPLFDEWLTP